MTPSTTNFPLSTIPTINFYPTLDMEGKKNTTKCTKRNIKKNEIKRNKRKRSHNYFAYLVIIVIKKKKKTIELNHCTPSAITDSRALVQ